MKRSRDIDAERKFSGAGFTLGGRCGSLAVGASLQGRLYEWRPREMALKAGYPRRQGPDVNPQKKISDVISQCSAQIIHRILNISWFYIQEGISSRRIPDRDRINLCGHELVELIW